MWLWLKFFENRKEYQSSKWDRGQNIRKSCRLAEFSLWLGLNRYLVRIRNSRLILRT